MLEYSLKKTLEFTLHNYNQILSTNDIWKDIPEDIQNEFYKNEIEILEIFQNNFINYKPEWNQIIDTYQKITFRNEKKPIVAAKANMIINQYINPILFDYRFSEDLKKNLLLNKENSLIELIDEEGLISSKKVELGTRLSFRYKNINFGFHDSIPHSLQFLLFKLAEEGQEILFRPDPLNFTEGNSFFTKIQKAHYFGRKFDQSLLTKRLRQLKEKSQFIRLSENPDQLSFDRQVYKFEVIRTERDRIFYLAEALPYSIEDAPETNITTFILHSESDENTSHFFHIDSSVLIYNHETYLNRCKNDIDKKIKANKHLKLFRINNTLPIDLWIDILVNLYPRNELILDFLDQNY
ncbi:hypothetical protein ACO2KH_18650 [Leptospira terpstrae]|uniref:hypothetical protein n=1 Tax=Leptospira terpstrae TaxID=293075 RepID=UPI003D051EE8